MDGNFVFDLLEQVPLKVRENIKISIQRLIEYNDRKGYLDFGKLDSELLTLCAIWLILNNFIIEIKIENYTYPCFLILFSFSIRKRIF